MNNVDFLKNTVEDLSNTFTNCYVNKIQALTNFDFLFMFSKNSLGSIFVSINPTFPFLKLNKKKFTISNQQYFLNKIKPKIENSKLVNIEVLNNDNIVAFHFDKVNDLYEKIHYILIFELFKNNTNIILTDKNKIVEALHIRNLDTNRPILLNMNYTTPKEIPIKKEIDEKEIIFKEDKHIEEIEQLFLDEKYGYVKKTLKAKIKSLNTKIEKVKKDKDEASKKMIYKDLGDYLLTNYEEEKNKKEIVFNGIIYNLDPRLSFDKNIQKLYKNYKKAKLTIQISDKYIQESIDMKEYLETILNELSFLNEDDYLELIKELENNNILKINKHLNKKQVQKTTKPYYILVGDTKIGYGKNNIQNDYLTFKLARKEDYFLHINKKHGPHVVIFSTSPTLKEKEIASEIAIYLSKNTVGEVLYSKIKDVKKADMPGKVNILKYETFEIREFKYDIFNLLKESKRF